MKSPLASALFCLALLAPSGALAADPAPNEEKPAETTPPAEAPAQPGGDQKYGTFALDANGNKVSGDALKNLPPEAKWAMETKGYSPVLGPNGEVLGYDNGMMCILPDAVGKDYAAASQQAMLPPGVAGPCPPNFPNCHSPEAGQQPPPLITASNLVENLGDSKNHCDQPGPPPPCAPKDQSPEVRAEAERDAAQQQVADAAKAGDKQALAQAIEDRNRTEDAYNAVTGGQNPGFGAASFGGPEGGMASNGPAPQGPSGGGQGIGAQGQVGASGLDGRQVRASAEQEADAMLAFQQGMKNGPLDGPRDANVRSVAQVADRGLGGRAFDAARTLFSSLSESLSAAADAPETDLSDQLATSPIDGAPGNRAPIKVTECDSTQHDTIGTKGKKVRRAGGC